MKNYFTIALLLFTVIDVVLLDKRNKTNRIIEGGIAKLANYPFMASLLYYDSHMCGGSIISDTVILTAAHCCSDAEYVLFDVNLLSVAVGNSKWEDGHKFNVSEFVIHENFDTEEFLHDIALWIVKNKMSDLNNVKPIKLSSCHIREHTRTVHATVLGWGYTSEQGVMVENVSDELFMVKIDSMPLEECRKLHDEISDDQMCFISPDRRGSCFGDSGGPLVMHRRSKLVQIGLVSFGEDCNNTMPEVYTRISTHYSWIKKNVMKITKKKL